MSASNARTGDCGSDSVSVTAAVCTTRPRQLHCPQQRDRRDVQANTRLTLREVDRSALTAVPATVRRRGLHRRNVAKLSGEATRAVGHPARAAPSAAATSQVQPPTLAAQSPPEALRVGASEQPAEEQSV